MALFRNAPGFRGTELIQSTDDASTYLTIDRWESAEAWGAFLDAWRDEYHQLDRACEALTISETEIGSFSVAEGTA